MQSGSHWGASDIFYYQYSEGGANDGQKNVRQEPDFEEEEEARESLEDVQSVDQRVVAQAVVSATDWTTETILSQIDKGNIFLNPHFQRRDAWNRKKKSAFIESLFLGLPIPQIVLAENSSKKGSYIVLDGKQRLLSIRQFAAALGDDKFKRLKLRDLDIRKDLTGKSLEDIKDDPILSADLSSFENQAIRTVVIRNWPNEDFLYQVFLRLNTGSLSLSPQELRQALHPGPFIDFVDTASGESAALKGILRRDEPDFRMRDVELLIRFFAFQYFLPTYNGSLKSLLDKTCAEINRSWGARSDEIIEKANDFEAAYDAVCEIFTVKSAFRKWIGGGYETRFNRAIYDVMMYFFADQEIRSRALRHKRKVENAFKNLCLKDKSFLASIERTTKSIEATHTRLTKWAKVLSEITSLRISPPIIGAET